ncbi:hypothetical protein R3Q06_11440 [Rhodococcus erythropolis]|uniref:hypothetical protein n=1 Tax=Rhodococcus erythropolis TaxID=1833 RepID=UPI0029499986|nr:hypothetical protein [Rhodococcus erythropolis]MDV6274114.1 hypothetical protein [Rhodococcus erythropolis]
MSMLKGRRERVGRWAYAPLVVVIAAGAIGGGMGVGSADTDTAPTIAAAPASTGDLNWWTLKNETGQSISGFWAEQSSENVSRLDLVEDMPLKTGGFEKRPRNDSPAWHLTDNPYWWAHICFNQWQWNLNGLQAFLSEDGAFTLSDENGALKATWNVFNGPRKEMLLTRNIAEGSC